MTNGFRLNIKKSGHCCPDFLLGFYLGVALRPGCPLQSFYGSAALRRKKDFRFHP